ncbi:MAG: hypothetical protein IPI28_17390 [Candidatus Omnitrophica bacterium]|nr:hypothetical protein [Candidatus Omnitrophota bacterium]
MGRLIYMFTSLAERIVDNQPPLIGMERLADILHDYEVPITWLVSPESAAMCKKQLKEWDGKFGDEVAMTLPTNASGDSNSRALHLAGAKSKKDLLAARLLNLKKTLPWAEISIAAGGHTDPEVAEILEDLGFQGLWGYCLEQIDVDDISDRGCPWGFFYIDPKQRLRPKRDGRGLVGMEWTARDLGKSIFSGNPTIYSTDPNDVARAGICRPEDPEYWFSLMDRYASNTLLNDFVFMVQHQEAHEMQASPFNCYSKEDIREASLLLEMFVSHFASQIDALTLSEGVDLYKSMYAKTAPSFMYWEDIPCPLPNPDYSWNTPVGPWPNAFMMYDSKAMMVFREGQISPFMLRNYSLDLTKHAYFNEPVIPAPCLVSDTRYHWKRDIQIQVNSPRKMPYGLALWGDYSLYRVPETPQIKDSRIIPGKLLFVRIDLDQGENRIDIRLQGK